MKYALYVFLFSMLAIGSPAAHAADQTLFGEYYHFSDNETLELMGDIVCFTPDAASAAQLPRQENLVTRFCFDDTGAAKKAFGIPAQGPASVCHYFGNAEIRISNYRFRIVDGDSNWNEAHLEQVVSHEAPRQEACNP